MFSNSKFCGGCLIAFPLVQAFCATPDHLVLRRREAASKDGLGGANKATNWTIHRDAMHGIAPQDEVVEFGSIPKLQLDKLHVMARNTRP
jgi:hypothetical protein